MTPYKRFLRDVKNRLALSTHSKSTQPEQHKLKATKYNSNNTRTRPTSTLIRHKRTNIISYTILPHFQPILNKTHVYASYKIIPPLYSIQNLVTRPFSSTLASTTTHNNTKKVKSRGKTGRAYAETHRKSRRIISLSSRVMKRRLPYHRGRREFVRAWLIFPSVFETRGANAFFSPLREPRRR